MGGGGHFAYPRCFRPKPQGQSKATCKDMNRKAGRRPNCIAYRHGRKYNLKTNNKGEYFSLGLVPAVQVTLTQDCKQRTHGV